MLRMTSHKNRVSLPTCLTIYTQRLTHIQKCKCQDCKKDADELMEKMHKCKSVRLYSKTWDAYYCPDCDMWLETICQDENCEYCSKRPFKPSLRTVGKKEFDDFQNRNYFLTNFDS